MKGLLRSVLLALIWGSVSFGSAQGLPREFLRTITEAVVQIVSVDDQVRSVGSGTVISPDGFILTNFHVIGDSDTGQAYPHHAILVTDPDATHLAPEHRYWARLVHEDPDRDLALLKIEATDAGRPLPETRSFTFVERGDSDALGFGDSIYIFGYPAVSGVTITMTTGTVSGWLGENRGAGRAWIKTDANLNRGNSGGGAFNSLGQLIGVPTRNLLDGRSGGPLDEEQGLVRPINIAGFIGAYLPDPHSLPEAAGVDPSAVEPEPQGESASTVFTVRPGADLGDLIPVLPEGSTVHLAPGVYRLSEVLEITRSLTLVGDGPTRDDVRIVSTATGTLAWFTGEGTLTIRGISFAHEGDAWANVLVIERGEVFIEDSRFTGAVWDEEQKSGGSGLVFWADAVGGVVRNNTFENNHNGISIYGRAAPTLEGNTVRANGWGVGYFEDARGLARNNIISDNHGVGIQLGDQAQPTLEGNTVRANGWGVGYFEDARGLARNNIISDNDDVGIQIGGRAAPTLEGNTVRANGWGVGYFEDARGLARNNIISDNDGVGIQIGGRAAPTLKENTVHGNERGIRYFEDARGLVRDNIVSDNDGIGIHVGDQAQPSLESNTVQGNEQGGLLYDGDAGGMVRDNIIGDNESFDIDVRDRARPDLVAAEATPEPVEPSPDASTDIPELLVSVPGADPTMEESGIIVALCDGHSAYQTPEACQKAQLRGLAFLKNPDTDVDLDAWQDMQDRCEREWGVDYSLQASCVRLAIALPPLATTTPENDGVSARA